MAHGLAEYEIIQFDKGDFKDQNGNYWCTMAVRGVSEPVRIVVKDPMHEDFLEGKSLYGKITDETSKANKPYLRFRREKREDSQQDSLPVKSDKPSPEYWDDKNAQIRAQWAIGRAVDMAVGWNAGPPDENAVFNTIESTAHKLFDMVDRVSGKENDDEAQEKLGQEIADKVGEVASEVADEIDEKPINMDDIPF
jgi:hypothetical protein